MVQLSQTSPRKKLRNEDLEDGPKVPVGTTLESKVTKKKYPPSRLIRSVFLDCSRIQIVLLFILGLLYQSAVLQQTFHWYLINPTIFSYARPDRSGAAIHDMLMCHAYAFSRGLKYGGACVVDGVEVKKDFIQQRKNLLRKLGLHFPVLSECPRGARVAGLSDYHFKPELFSPEYMDHLRSTSTSSTNVSTQRAPRIAVHIRRGDVEPCGKNGMRYLPNSYYLALIDIYTKKLKQRMKSTGVNNYTSEEIEVRIFSQSGSHESFDVFRNLGYTLKLDGAPQTAWKSMIYESDVIILSISSFSMLPSILSLALSGNPTTTIVYTPFWHLPLPQFDNVGELYPKLLESAEAELNSTCGKKVHVGKPNGWT